MESSAIYGLESQGRTLCSHLTEIESVRFFVGTLSTRSEGQIHQIDFEDDMNQISRKVYKPKIGEIWQMQCAPTNNLIGLVYNHISDNSCRMKCGIWKLPGDDQSTNGGDLDPVVELELTDVTENVRSLDWHSTKPQCIISYENSFAIWDVTDGHHKVKSTLNLPNLYGAKWNPHLDGNQFALISASSVTGMDLRSMKDAWKIPKAHKFQVRDIDFNPNKQYYMATCGDDCSARFWDFRNPSQPLKELMCHTHWVWRVRFNTFHDQLVLTSGSDSRVLLHSLPSISSEPQGRTLFSDSEEEDRAAPPPLEEGILAKYEEHEDAVYAVEWSSYDPWIFASLSYDGRLVINRVPKSQKYKILL